MTEAQNPGDSELVVVHVAPNFHAARILEGFLESEGIQAKVPGAELSDEFGSAMKMGACEVVVRRGDLERAKDVVAAWEGADEEE